MPIINTVIAGGGSPVIDPLNVTPSTSAQTITASGGVDGDSPVNVSAVDASIDANITSANIKSGVSILGVAGSVTELNGSTETVTPTTSQQTVTPTSPSNGLTSVTVNAVTNAIDANITAGNIKKDVTILGVTGSYEGTTPTGTIPITSNGVYDVAGYANADVQVPTTAPALYREFQLNNNGMLRPNTTTAHIMSFTGMTDVSDYALARAYLSNTAISGAVDMSDLTTVSGSTACSSMFQGCTGLTSADLSSLTTISGSNACNSMFSSCTGLTSVDLSSLTTVSGSTACSSMFQGCAGLTSVDLSSLTTVSVINGCNSMFRSTKLTSVDLPSLTTVSGSTACSSMFQGCTNLTRVSFYALDTNSFGTRTNQFDNMLSGVTGCTVHFPMRIQSTIGSWTSVTNGFGGTNTTVLFDIVCTLTGTDTNTYTRSQKNSTSTATAWDNGGTLYYTSGTSEPAVSDTIYSDAACTTAVTTISSIA